MICPQKCQSQFHADSCVYRTKWLNHNKGSFVRIIADGPPVATEKIKKWIRDPDHGFLHGLLTAFFVTMLKYPNGISTEIYEEQTSKKINTPITDYERLIVSALLHDFVKSCFQKEPHDSLLKNYFFSLSKEVYEHADPKNLNFLVYADRWELLRYKDYKNWINFDHLYFDSLEIKEQILGFQHHMRPALEQLFLGFDDVWLRHSPEKNWNNKKFSKLTPNCFYPPHGYWNARQDDENFYAIEIGTLPPRACLIHGYAKNNSKFDDDPSSYSPYGLISLKNAKKFHYTDKLPMITPCVRVDMACDDLDIQKSKKQKWPTTKHLGDTWEKVIKKNGYANSTFISREHLASQSKIPLKNWIFLYDDNRHLEKLYPQGKKKFIKDWTILLKKSAGVINLHLAANILEIAKQVEAILLCIKT